MKTKNIIIGLFLISGFLAISQKETHEIAKGVKVYQDLFNSSMKEGVACYRIPSIVTAPNGDVIAAIDERVPSCNDVKYNPNINIVIRRSSNNGRTWSPIETVVDFPMGQTASDPSMIVDMDTKEILLFYNYMDLDKEKDAIYLHMVKSSDDGKTWSQPIDITSQIAKPEWHNDHKFITSGRGIQTKSGKLLHTLVNVQNGLHIIESDNHGKSWNLIDKTLVPGDESKIVELVDGRWMINVRVKDAGMRYVHLSDDEGKTWNTSPAPELIDPSCNASIIRYTSIEDGFKKNRLLFSNAKSDKNRVNMTVHISYDEGKTWSDSKTIYTGGSAYSSMTIFENGDIGLFFEKDDYTENAFVSFSLKWLTDGKDKWKKPSKKRKIKS